MAWRSWLIGLRRDRTESEAGLMEDGAKTKLGSGFISPAGRTAFLGVASIPMLVLVAHAISTPARDVLSASLFGLLLFFPVIFALLMAGRTFEFFRDREWRASKHPLLKLSERQFMRLNFAVIALCLVCLFGKHHISEDWLEAIRPFAIILGAYYAYFLMVKVLQVRDQRNHNG